MRKLRIAFEVVLLLRGGVARGIKLKDESDYAVRRDLLELSYPAYKSFRGLMHSGLMPAAVVTDDMTIGRDDFSSYFFVLLRPDGDDGNDAEGRTDETFRNDTLLIWLNGGPGVSLDCVEFALVGVLDLDSHSRVSTVHISQCSSMTGLMAEMGPVGTPNFGPGIPSPNPAPLVKNKYAWTKKSAMLFVEQPGGVGFSIASKEWTGEMADERTEKDVASSFYAFLQNIYTVFGDDLAKKELYISGESYAGMYIPSIAHEIHLQNKRIYDSLATPSVVDASVIHNFRHERNQLSRIIPIRGLAIGNGWIDAKIQGPTTIDFAWWHGMIDLQDHRNLHTKWDECMNMQIIDSSEKPFHPFNVPDECGITSAVMKASGSKFMYDVTASDAYPAILDEGMVIELVGIVPFALTCTHSAFFYLSSHQR
jgi:carboxypeptidase C (cathepsin A)